MEKQDCAKYLSEIMDRFLKGTPMSGEARAHYVNCPECIAAVTAELGKNCDGRTGVNHRTPEEAEAVRAAIARGRQVLEREFGIPAKRAIAAK